MIKHVFLILYVLVGMSSNAQSLKDDLPSFIDYFKKKDQPLRPQFCQYIQLEELDTAQLYTEAHRYFEEAKSHIFIARVNDRIDGLASYAFFQILNDSIFKEIGITPLHCKKTNNELVYYYGTYVFNETGFKLCTHTKVIDEGIEYSLDPLSIVDQKKYRYPADYIRYEHNCIEKYFANKGRLAARVYTDSTFNDWDYDQLDTQDKESLFFGMQSLFAQHNFRFKEEYLFHYFKVFYWYDPLNDEVSSMMTERDKDLLEWLKKKLSE